jgi:hypothetical protein
MRRTSRDAQINITMKTASDSAGSDHASITA